MAQFSKIDELLLPQHCFLDVDDQCFFLREYLAYGGYQSGETNQLIFNLKKTPDKRGTREWYWKGVAIRKAASELRSGLSDTWLDSVCLVPMPSSKCTTDPMYDDRIVDMVRQMAAGTSAKVIELVETKVSRPGLHAKQVTRNVAELMTNMRINTQLLPAAQACEAIAIVDDVIAAGTHFKAVSSLIRQFCPQRPIYGFFVARRIINDDDDDDDQRVY